ncbi:type II toxin-antitoxin system PrlF family antitoxin [Devosia epidermidihirudinis]|nr:type II toxin-antitoxin system PrlF family antitoxin [Devosia epidermidihirudinis]
MAPEKEGVMITSTITTRARTTIPRAVLSALSLRKGDTVAYAIRGDTVILSKAEMPPSEDQFGAFNEWHGEADREAYRTL